MQLLSNTLIAFIVLAHCGFLVLEMFFWDHPIGQKIFSMTPEVAASSAVLAANQGLYNGFLAAGLLWGLLSSRSDIKVFFLSCILIAGLFGAATAKMTILFTQALPALIALTTIWLLKRN